MITLNSKLTKQILNNEILNICKLKKTFFGYSLNSNIKWFKKNIKKNDFHILLYFKKVLIGYICLRRRTSIINKKKIKYFYFDTVIINSKYKGKSFGNLIMMSAINIIQKENIHSFLLCENKLVKYYKKFNFNKIKKKNYDINDHDSSLNGMIFNFSNLKVTTKITYYIFS